MSAVGVSTWIAPLCPAGHLPHKGGDRDAAPSRAPSNQSARGYEWDFRRFACLGLRPGSRVLMGTERMAVAWSISPLVGEMPGRAEGGNVTRKGDAS
ncbi:hypothetical protein C0075_16115 [Rhizobium sp. KAs_5_22]|nr:hypothetical protein C0075_16115 [Rhizobium sp. KAs_5_22]